MIPSEKLINKTKIISNKKFQRVMELLKAMKSKFKEVHAKNKEILAKEDAKKRQEFRDKVRLHFWMFALAILSWMPFITEVKQMMEPRLIIINNVQAQVVEEKKVEEPKQDVSAIVYKIYRLESSAGINDSCKEYGKFNGYGYAIYEGSYKCFESHEQVTKIVTKWMEEKLKTYSLPEAVCGYNLGFKSEHLQDCINRSEEYPYYRNYLKL